MFDATWAQALATLFLGLVGLWFANSYRRQVRVQLAERQLDAYTRLWRITAPARPDRQTPLDEAERQRIHAGMFDWYFADGDGVLLPVRSRDLFVALGGNLVGELGDVTPKAVAAQLNQADPLEADRRRGCLCLRQMSLLRQQLKSDLSLHIGYRYHTTLRPDERALLRACGIPLWRKPWRRRPRLWAPKPPMNPCVCGLCEPRG